MHFAVLASVSASENFFLSASFALTLIVFLSVPANERKILWSIWDKSMIQTMKWCTTNIQETLSSV